MRRCGVDYSAGQRPMYACILLQGQCNCRAGLVARGACALSGLIHDHRAYIIFLYVLDNVSF